MLENKTDIKLVQTLFDNVKNTGTVSREDIVSLEEQIPDIISDLDLNVRRFTVTKSSTNVPELVIALESMLIEVVTKEYSAMETVALGRKLKKILLRLKTEYSNLQFLKYDEIINGNVYGRYIDTDTPDATFVNLLDMPINEFLNNLEYILNIVGKIDSSVDQHLLNDFLVRFRVDTTEIKNFSLIFMAYNNDSTNSSSILTTTDNIIVPTVANIITELLVENRFCSILENTIKQVEMIEDHILGFKSYNDGFFCNNTTTFHYEYLTKIENLLDDKDSLKLLTLLALLVR